MHYVLFLHPLSLHPKKLLGLSAEPLRLTGWKKLKIIAAQLFPVRVEPVIHSLILIPPRCIGELNRRLEFDRGYPFPMLFFEFLYNHGHKALL